MENWLTDIMNDFGYIGIAFLIAVENIFPPIPSEVVLTFGGFMTTQSNLGITGVVIAATAGSVGGAVVLYFLGSQLGVERLERIVGRWGHVLRLEKADIHKAQGWFDKYGYWTVFFCRFIPLMRSLISIPAGMAKMNIIPFLLLTTAGTLIWNVVLVYLGASVGNSWQTIVDYMNVYSRIVYAILIILALILIYLFIRKKK
ncbi:DedA family protein [Salinicoccus luteus]|uniref:DedA family protein n=1 Tax=Salinicoccus luteus TaxID=367840 RepID=UPI0004E1B5A1|nr:DedA family protein [Salinicoccus luteus]